MRTITTFFILMLGAGLVAADWVYEGEWGGAGGQGISVAPGGRVYVLKGNSLVQYFTPTGSFIGKWSLGEENALNLAVGPSRCVYVTQGTLSAGYIYRFTATGSILNTWWCGGYLYDVAVSPSENVYVTSFWDHKVSFYSSAGSILGSWGSAGTGDGQFSQPHGIAVTRNGNVYVADSGNHRVQYFTSTGSFLGKWFTGCVAVAVAPSGNVFVTNNGRVREFSSTGTLLSIFESPDAGWLAVSPSGDRVYVTDTKTGRVIYYRESEPAVAPSSLGRVKALFR